MEMLLFEWWFISEAYMPGSRLPKALWKLRKKMNPNSGLVGALSLKEPYRSQTLKKGKKTTVNHFLKKKLRTKELPAMQSTFGDREKQKLTARILRKSHAKTRVKSKAFRKPISSAPCLHPFQAYALHRHRTARAALRLKCLKAPWQAALTRQTSVLGCGSKPPINPPNDLKKNGKVVDRP